MTEKIIRQDNSVLTGYFDDRPIDFNYGDYVQHDEKGKKKGRLFHRYNFHVFNYLGIVTERWMAGLAAVSLGFLDNVFAYLIDRGRGIVYQYNSIKPTIFAPSGLYRGVQPDRYDVAFRKGRSELAISKDASGKSLELRARFDRDLSVEASFEYDLKKQRPLRVANTSGLTHWGFTEKNLLARTKKIAISRGGETLDAEPGRTFLIYDFSAGYMLRHTEWFWIAFSGSDGRTGKPVGGNFAINNNYPVFSENGLWIGGERFYFHNNIVYSFRDNDPAKEWNLYTVNEKGTKDGRLDMVFVPGSAPDFVRQEYLSTGLVNSNFRQLFGTISGSYREGKKKYSFSDIFAIAETHSADW